MGICVWVSFILLQGGGWRLVGGGMGAGWFSQLMSSIWLTQTQEVARAACLVNTVLYLCDTPKRRGGGIIGVLKLANSPPHVGQWVTTLHSPFRIVSYPHPEIFGPRSSGASVILWLKPVKFMSENSAIFETSFGSDGTKIPLGLYVLFVVLLELLSPIKPRLNVLN